MRLSLKPTPYCSCCPHHQATCMAVALLTYPISQAHNRSMGQNCTAKHALQDDRLHASQCSTAVSASRADTAAGAAHWLLLDGSGSTSGQLPAARIVHALRHTQPAVRAAGTRTVMADRAVWRTAPASHVCDDWSASCAATAVPEKHPECLHTCGCQSDALGGHDAAAEQRWG